MLKFYLKVIIKVYLLNLTYNYKLKKILMSLENNSHFRNEELGLEKLGPEYNLDDPNE
jgi:hypothetical protein